MSRRIVYQNWIVDIGRDPDIRPQQFSESSPYNQDNIAAVNQALAALTPTEAEIIRRFHFRGQGYRQISGAMKVSEIRLQTDHKRALNKIKIMLKARFGGPVMGIRAKTVCPICAHPARSKIETLIRNRQKHETWTRIMKSLKIDFGLKIRSPQTIVSHLMYHRLKEPQNG